MKAKDSNPALKLAASERGRSHLNSEKALHHARSHLLIPSTVDVIQG